MAGAVLDICDSHIVYLVPFCRRTLSPCHITKTVVYINHNMRYLVLLYLSKTFTTLHNSYCAEKDIFIASCYTIIHIKLDI